MSDDPILDIATHALLQRHRMRTRLASEIDARIVLEVATPLIEERVMTEFAEWLANTADATPDNDPEAPAGYVARTYIPDWLAHRAKSWPTVRAR